MKPFMKYPGGKTKDAPFVNKYMPSNIDRYFEPFVGGGAIFFEMNCDNYYINDYSKDLIDLYELLKNQDLKLKNYLECFNELWKNIEANKDQKELLLKFGSSIMKYNSFYNSAYKKKKNTLNKFETKGIKISSEDKKEMELTARKTALYMVVRDIYNDKSIMGVLHIACYYILREYCYSSMFRFSSKGAFNVPYGGRSYNQKYLNDKIEYMYSSEMKEKLSKTSINNCDFEVFLKNYRYTDTDFIFLDPPYDSDFSTYDNNSFDRAEQIRLRNILSKIDGAKWMLIIKKTDFISDLYKNYFIYEYDKNYMVSFKNRNDKEVKHLLITNYEIEVK